MKKDLFVAPFDWRIAPTFSESFWPEFKKLIEKAYDMNKTKVTLIGFSQGDSMIHQFLTKHCTSEWKENFISQVIFISPAFTGFVQDLYNLWVKENPFVPFIHLDSLSFCFEQMPGVYAILPNEVIFKDAVIAIGPDGEEFKGKDLNKLLINHLLFNNENAQKILNKTEETLSVAPNDIGVKTTLLMNSGVKTAIALNFSNGFDKKPKRILDGGDGTLTAFGYKWVCKNWKNITCVDFKNSGDNYHHYPLISNNRVLNFVSNITYYNQVPEFEQDEEYFNIKDEL